MLIKILLVTHKKDVVRFVTADGRIGTIPYQQAKHVQAGDICMIEQSGSRSRVRLILDDDPLVAADDPINKQLVALR